jgi:phosphosulfolactate synthase (CoM biosynthesis protein A)
MRNKNLTHEERMQLLQKLIKSLGNAVLYLGNITQKTIIAMEELRRVLTRKPTTIRGYTYPGKK